MMSMNAESHARDPLRLIVRWRRTDRRIIGRARSPHGIRHRPSWSPAAEDGAVRLCSRLALPANRQTLPQEKMVWSRVRYRSRCSSHGGPGVPGRSGVRATSQLRQDGSRRTRAVGRTIGVMDGRTSLSVVLPSGASPCPSSISCSSIANLTTGILTPDAARDRRRHRSDIAEYSPPYAESPVQSLGRSAS